MSTAHAKTKVASGIIFMDMLDEIVGMGKQWVGTAWEGGIQRERHYGFL